MKIVAVGTGCVGLSNAVLLAQKYEVVALDIDPDRVAVLNERKSTTVDPEIEEFLSIHGLKFCATLDKADAYAWADYAVVAPSADFDPVTNNFGRENGSGRAQA